MLTDPISDMLTRIRNAGYAGKTEVVFPFSRLKYEISKIFEKEGFVDLVQKQDKERQVSLKLKYAGKDPAIRHIARISKPGRRVYKKHTELPKILNDAGLAIVSTSQGIMTNKEARNRKLGGEVICEIY